MRNAPPLQKSVTRKASPIARFWPQVCSFPYLSPRIAARVSLASLTDYGFVHAPAPSGFRARCYARYREMGARYLGTFFKYINAIRRTDDRSVAAAGAL